MADSILPSLDAIQARADAVLLCDRPDCDLRKCQDQRDNAAMLAALRAALDALGPHWDEQVRRESKFGRTESSCVCYGCNAIRAVTAHIDTTPKEKP